MTLFFLIAALVLAILGAVPIPSRINLLAASLACYFASLLVGRF